MLSDASLPEWLQRAEEAAEIQASKFAELENLLTNFKIKLKTRMVFYNTYVKSRMTYACQTWKRQAETKTWFRTPPVFTAYGMYGM